VIGIGGIVFGMLMALSTRYGFHRDELYFLASAQHLQASYVDQPVLAPHPLVAGRRPGPGPRAGQQAQRGLLPSRC